MPSPLPDPVDLGLVHRALVTKLRHHGDVLLASPVFTVLGRAAPAAEIDALVYAETAAMLAGHPAIAQTHVIDRDWKRQGFVRQCARRACAAVGTLEASLRSHRPSDRASARRVALAPAAAALQRRAPSRSRALAVANELHPLLPAAATDAAAHRRMQSRQPASHRRAACAGRQGAGPRAERRRDSARARSARPARDRAQAFHPAPPRFALAVQMLAR